VEEDAHRLEAALPGLHQEFHGLVRFHAEFLGQRPLAAVVGDGEAHANLGAGRQRCQFLDLRIGIEGGQVYPALVGQLDQ
jgi:hypothetical protein